MARAALLALALTATLALAAIPASAHEAFDVGTYHVEVAWLYEPPVVDQPNAVTITIHQGDGDSVKAVTDGVTLTATLELNGAQKSLSLETSDDTPGTWAGAVVPTVAGDYTVHVTGTVGGERVDHTTKLETVDAPSENAFPATHGTVKELQDRLETVEYTAWGLGGGALLLGLVALIVALARRKPAAPAPARPAQPSARPPQR